MKKFILLAVFILSAVSAFTQNYFEEKDTFDRISGLSYSKPAFIDLDNDGLLDLIIGNSAGTLHHYEQNALNSTEFDLVTANFCNIDVGYSSTPAFTDLDNDGLLDLIIGENYGKLYHYEQKAANSTEFDFVTYEFNNIDVGYLSAPAFTDLDNDGLLDLIIGEDDDNLNHYVQNAVNSNEFDLVNENFSNIDVGWSSAPAFTDLDNDGKLDLIIGEWEGNLNHYEQKAVNSTEFDLVTSNFNNIDVGYLSAPAFTDLDNDGMSDLIIGNEYDRLYNYEQNAENSIEFNLVNEHLKNIISGNYFKPAITDLDNDGKLDLITGDISGSLIHFEQTEVNTDEFKVIDTYFCNIDVGSWSAPAFTDLDNDGLLDLIIGEWSGKLHHYEQNAANSNEFDFVTDDFNNIDVGRRYAPASTDLDNDGLLDLIIGEYYGKLYHYEQKAVNSTEFDLVTENFNNIDIGYYAKPVFTDLDNDGLLDLIIGNNSRRLHHYEQNAVNSTEFDLVTDKFNNIDVGWEAAPTFTDLDNDGLLDLIIGEKYGMSHYEQVSGNLPVQLSSFAVIQTSENCAEIEWVTQTENDMRGYYVYRGYSEDITESIKLNPEIIPAHNAPTAVKYSYKDETVNPGETYRFWLESAGNDGVVKTFGPLTFTLENQEDVNPADIPDVSYLNSSYPNPFNISKERNGEVSIGFGVKENDEADLTVYNLKGQLVEEFKGYKPGNHTVNWNLKTENGKKAKSGIYFYRLKTKTTDITHKMLIIK
ncbi:MAG: hypothetical protein CSB55_05755 [Candidatus Cloacimonadota bacterium]|nr:MAG: hypothetical protein CSB55_05755 [Candidatus Cloacimonadota bacterium]